MERSSDTSKIAKIKTLLSMPKKYVKTFKNYKKGNDKAKFITSCLKK